MRKPLVPAAFALFCAAALVSLVGCSAPAAQPTRIPTRTQHITGIGLNITLTTAQPVKAFDGIEKPVTPVHVVMQNTTAADVSFLGGTPTIWGAKGTDGADCVGTADQPDLPPAPTDIAAHATAKFTLYLAASASKHDCVFSIGKFAHPVLSAPLTIEH